MPTTIFRLGWSDPLSDAFGAHPLLGPVLDLNDGVTFTLLAPEALDLAPPPRTLALAGNVRSQGERGVSARFRQNRQVVARAMLGPMASFGDLATNVRALVAWLDAPPAVPFAIQYQPPNASQPVYLDVVGAAHDIPTDEADWLRLQLEPIELVFIARPGLRGDRLTLSNLVTNPGFEAPAGPGVSVFNDALANLDAYTVISGAVPSLSASVMTLPAGAMVGFGSPAWGPITSWTIRWQYLTGSIATFYLHFVDGNNYLFTYAQAGSITIVQTVAGTQHQLGVASYASLSSGSWYWLTCTQFPTAPGAPALVRVSLASESGGAPGAAIATCGPVPTWDGVTALSGAPALQATGAALPIGGAFTNVQTFSLFGPGAWGFGSYAAAVCAGAWEQVPANTYSGGPVTSFGAARIDLPPSGPINAAWYSFNGGGAASATAIPVRAPGDVLAAQVWARGTGLGAQAQTSLSIYEYDASGAFVRATTVATRSGPLAAWQTLAGTLTTGANTAYLGLFCGVTDSTSGSAGGTVWFENVQCWNQTATGQASMPYCELRFAQAPAQLVVSGLLGDLPAPAHVALGTYLADWAPGGTLTYALGRAARGNPAARLVGTSHGYYGPPAAPPSTAFVDGLSYGGYAVQQQVGSGGWNPRAISPRASDAPGAYHLWARLLTQQSASNLANVQVRTSTQQRAQAWYGLSSDTDAQGASYGPYSAPFAASSAWTVADCGQVTLPPFSAGFLSDPTQSFLTPRPQLVDTTGGGSLCEIGWQMLLPVDGSLLLGVLNNPSNGPFAVMGQWLWAYLDGLAVNRAAAADAPAWTWSVEGTALPNPGRGAGGPGTQSSGSININSGADPYLTLDPMCAGAINVLAALFADGSGAVVPLAAEIRYSPLFLYPR